MAIFAFLWNPKKNALSTTIRTGFHFGRQNAKISRGRKKKKKHKNTASPSILFNFLLPTFLGQP
jgi:hypothetical protein